jgi:hypothetical protein
MMSPHILSVEYSLDSLDRRERALGGQGALIGFVSRRSNALVLTELATFRMITNTEVPLECPPLKQPRVISPSMSFRSFNQAKECPVPTAIKTNAAQPSHTSSQ